MNELSDLIIDDVTIPIVAAGSGWLAVDKPPDLSVHNDPGVDLCSLLNRYFSSHPMDAETFGVTDFGFHAVHRLDRSTSGLMLAACRRETLSFLATQFQARSVKKNYRAILHGRLNPAGPSEEAWGVWDLPLTKKAAGRKNPEGGGLLRPSETHYRILDHSSHYTLAELRPHTGRRHQIRRHAALAGHPVAGDKRYSPSRAVKFLRQRRRFQRLGLHAYAIELILPENHHRRQTLSTDRLPVEMQRLFDSDRG
jgi:RluA family pseudouridine synthase